MFIAIATFLVFVVVGTGAWIVTYRRSVGRGAGEVLSHVRGLVYSLISLGVLFILFAVVVGSTSSSSTVDTNVARKEPAHAETLAQTPVGAAALPDLEAQLARIYAANHFDALESSLEERHTDALKVIPALGGTTNVAKILKTRGIRLGRNAYVDCATNIKLADAPGCMLTVYLTRKPLQQQTDLSGLPAHWFQGLNDGHFRPLPGWAEHVDQNDNWLDPDGMLGYSDTR